MTAALDFFGDSVSSTHTEEDGGTTSKTSVVRDKKHKLGKRKHEETLRASSSDLQTSEDEDELKSNSGGSDDEPGGLELLAGHTPIGMRKNKVERRRERKKKRKRLDKETKEVLRRQKVCVKDSLFNTSVKCMVVGVTEATATYKHFCNHLNSIQVTRNYLKFFISCRLNWTYRRDSQY